MRAPLRLWPAMLAICSAATLLWDPGLRWGNQRIPCRRRRRSWSAGSSPAPDPKYRGLLYNRAVQFANQLTSVAPAEASGVRWESAEVVLTTTLTGTPPVQTVSAGRGGATVRDIFRGDLPPGEWVVAVARTGDGGWSGRPGCTAARRLGPAEALRSANYK